jgi:hypothetical protein
MTERLRAVFDTNVFVSALLSHNLYDPHFDPLHGVYGDIKITKALPFLWAVRGDQPLDDK